MASLGNHVFLELPVLGVLVHDGGGSINTRLDVPKNGCAIEGIGHAHVLCTIFNVF